MYLFECAHVHAPRDGIDESAIVPDSALRLAGGSVCVGAKVPSGSRGTLINVVTTCIVIDCDEQTEISFCLFTSTVLVRGSWKVERAS